MNIPLWILLFLVAFLGWVLRQFIKDKSAPLRWYVIGSLVFAISIQIYYIFDAIIQLRSIT